MLIEQVLKMDFSRVQRFFKKYKTMNPGVVANHFLSKTKSKIERKEKITPREVLTEMIENESYKKWRPEHIKVIKKNYEEALFVAEYYIMWAEMSQEDRKRIREMRVEISEWWNGLVLSDQKLIKDAFTDLSLFNLGKN